MFKYSLLFFLLFNFTLFSQENKIIVGAERFNEYLPLLKNKKVGIVTNQTGVVLKEGSLCKSKANKNNNAENLYKSIIDVLLQKKINVIQIFAPEHGFRGSADAGETVKDGKDIQTNLPIISLYGGNKKPKKEQIQDLDVIIFDIQDVGVRFYTYISTLHYVMEAAAENGKKVIVLDRPNPNIHYVDGPVLEKKFTSFVGMHPIPIVYGMTIGEYALMINGEKWLNNGIYCNLTVIPLENYTRNSTYSLPIKPSPNLPNDKSINLYPSTCFFEAINGSEGRGTDFPFQMYGSPYIKNMKFSFIPQPNEGSKNPRFKGIKCFGEDLRNEPLLKEINLKYLLTAYKNYQSKELFWIKNAGEFWIDKLAGTDQLRKQIDAGKIEKEIKKTWQKDINVFKKTRAKYLLYK